MAALRWISDDEPGIRRVRRGRGFWYVDAAGKRVGDLPTLERIRALVIPPAYTEVWICARPDGHLQATGRDARGRKQYRYHPQWQAERDATKFDRLREVGTALPRLRRRLLKHLRGEAAPTKERVIAALVQLLDRTGLRIGNPQYRRDNGSYGLSTLRKRHARRRGSDLTLSFKGKSGQRIEARLTDRRVARVIRRCQELPGQDLFQFLDDDGDRHAIDSADVNAWLADATGGVHLTAKDFRTWHGTLVALEEIVEGCRATQRVDPAPAPKATQVVAAVARQLGNTPAVCRKAYIHPEVLTLAESLRDADACARLLDERWVAAAPATRGLSANERRLIAWLERGARRRRL